MKRLFILPVLLMLALLALPVAFSQQQYEPAPTLVPPTPVPVPDSGEVDRLLSESGVARIQRDGRVRVGILFNAPPFGELTIRGEVAGFDADLARSMAEAWGVELDFIQVTRQNALDVLKSGQVDLLIAARIHRRELDPQVEFSQTYYVSQQSMMVRAEDEANELAALAGRRVGVVIGSDGERALNEWVARTGTLVTAQSYMTLDRAYVALVSGEVDGVVENRERLIQAATQLDLIRLLDEPVVLEPYAVAMVRQDVNLRNLVNRTLQYLLVTGVLRDLHHRHFPSWPFNEDVMLVWNGLDEEAPDLNTFATDVPFPPQYTAPAVLANGTLRVAGFPELPPNPPPSVQRLDSLNRSLIEQIARRWGVSVEYIPNSDANALDLVAAGRADLAVGIMPDWSRADLVDFTGPYLLHGDRLMVPAGGRFNSFNDLRGAWVAVLNNDPGAGDRAVGWANTINARIRLYTTREEDAAYTMLVDQNADVVFGDILALYPHVQDNPDRLALTRTADGAPRWYSRLYRVLAVPRNDISFRLLVEYTLQELVMDGTLRGLLLNLMPEEDMPDFDIWPGPGNYLGLSLRR